MNNTQLDLAVGSGLLFPLGITQVNGKSSIQLAVGDIKLIENNLTTFMVTQVGSICRQEHIGSRIYECIEEPNDETLSYLVKIFIKEEIIKYEPRIELLEVITNLFNSYMEITIRYNIYGIRNNIQELKQNINYGS